MDETGLLISKIEDLGYICKKNNYPAFSKFLDLTQEQRVKNIKAPGCRYFMYGGSDFAERKMVGCFPEDYPEDVSYFPIKIIKITPAKAEGLTHRDYLGAVLGLGIKRECIGDISINREEAYCFCTEEIADFIILNLKSVGKTSAVAREGSNVDVTPPELRRLTGTVASPRLDCILAFVMGKNRGKLQEHILKGEVMVNYLVQQTVSTKLKPGDIVSVRGFGKFIYIGEKGSTKKGRLLVEADLYI